ncbi:uncharacterized protein LOC127847111 isoform X3 [Dreissena polymorpha]|uniref:uncharacterized protein LOC127847111 isoform X3 n=1 Tax=Dreissena polymorpha TaxID=45954 RepID=UPI002264B439|nr:uncharacterized protein LOC127847111 isoform X3 [Dreissena polymorpha]
MKQSWWAANRMGSLIRETTGDEDDLPVGCEAGSMKKMKDKNDRKSSEKRLQWRSVVEKSVTSSLNSRPTQTLRSCVEQILCQREMDPETVLRNLGFDGSSADDPLNRIPDRFLAHQRLLQETSLAQYLLSHPELQGQLPVSGSQPFSSPQLMENWAQDQSAAGSSKSKRKGSLHSSFSTVARSIRFIQGAQTQAQAPVSPDEETKVLSAIPSILDLPNRRALARQGFYGPEYIVRRSSETGQDGKSPKGSMSAAERRRQFHYKVKSRNQNWSLTEEPKENKDHTQQDQGPARESVDSWDRAILLKSFSDRISSDSSYESNDSVGEERGRLKRENSISNLRRQYQNTIRQSVDRDGSVFTVDKDDVESVLEKSPHRITELRRRQVEGLMLSMVDDGDYCTEDGTVPASASSRTLAFVNAQNSKMSTLTGSPLTPKEFSYSFEDRLKDGESEFDFEKQPKPAKSCVSRPQNVSIIIEEDASSLDGVSKKEVNPLLQAVSSKNELSFPVLTQRSDSSNTLVPTESMGDNDPESDFASKSGDLDLDPCYADALSESASSLMSGETVIRGLSPFEHAGERTVRFPGSRQSMDDKRLKPLVNPPQESFELEEISSADVAHEDVGGVSRRSSIRRGHMEKTASTQSDSSGFADIDPAGEPTLADHKIRQATMLNEVPELAETSKLVSVSRKFRNIVEQDYEDNSNPALRTIAYTAETETGNKSVLYTVDLPLIPLPCQQLAKNSLQDQSRQPRYVSSLNLETELLDDDESEKSSESRVRVKPVGPAVFLTLHDLKNNQSHLSDENDFENCDNNLSAGEWRKEGLGIHDVNNETANDSQQTFQRERDVMQSKQSILQRKLSKQSMVASKTQTADWLLNNESKRKAFKMGRPNWASTPNLKPKGDARVTGVWKRHFQMEESMSLDIPPEESGDELSLKLRQHSLDFDHENILGNAKPHLKHLRGDSACASLDESMYSSKSSMLGSYQGVSDEYLNYLRLARLVNGPSPIMDIIPKMPNLKFRPTIHMKNWSKIPKQKMLEEETRLMQHAVQRYKTELAMMENMLFSLYSRVQSDLVPEERADVEELQQLWSQVRKEVIKMEDLLVDRLRAVLAGNASFSPLDSLEIVQMMIDLLREQLYHQQMCIARDVSFSDDEEDEGTGHFPARSLSGASVPSTSGLTGSSVDSAWARELSNQMNELKTSLEMTKESQKRELRERISELKTGLLSEVHREVETPTQNKRMLELELQARENEVRRLRMELLLQSVNTGGTRRKQVFESDV